MTSGLEQRLNAAIEHHRSGRLPEAEAGYRSVLADEPSHPEANHLLGVIALQRGDPAAALAPIGRAIEATPMRADIRSNLGQAYVGLGRMQEAEAAFRAALAAEPAFAIAHANLGNVLLHSGRREEAAQCYRRAAEIEPHNTIAHLNLGSVLIDLGRPRAAEESLRRALELGPDIALAHINLSTALLEQGRAEEAETSARAALALDPGSAAAHCGLGNALDSLGRLEEAVQCHRRALELDPAFVRACFNLGTVLSRLKRTGEAARCFRRSLELAPADPRAQIALGHALGDEGRTEEALAAFRRAVELAPDNFPARFACCVNEIPALYDTPEQIVEARARYSAALAALGDGPPADAPRAAIAEAADAVGNYHAFLLAYQGMNNRELQSRYGRLACRVMENWLGTQDLPPQPRRRPARKIRVGIVSAHLRRHSVWDVLTSGMLRGLDRTRFEVFAYHTLGRPDEETALAEKWADGFRQGPWPLRRWLERIRDDAPDVLLYPELGMDPVSTRLAALRLAPVQAASWGHPDTTGLPTIDYYLSGELLEAAEAQSHYSERLVKLPNLGCTFGRLPIEPVAIDLARYGVAGPERVRLISCQAMLKYLPQHDRVFPAIAKAVPSTQFVFVHSSLGPEDHFERFQRRLAAAFAAAGLEVRAHCVFLEVLPRARFYGLLQEMDGYLDTLGFSGFTTAFQALQWGLPIVTVEGEFMRGRLASSLLRRIGAHGLVARDIDDYIAIASRLAGDGAWRAAQRSCIERNVSLIFDDPAPLKALEAFLADAVERSRASA